MPLAGVALRSMVYLNDGVCVRLEAVPVRRGACELDRYAAGVRWSDVHARAFSGFTFASRCGCSVMLTPRRGSC